MLGAQRRAPSTSGNAAPPPRPIRSFQSNTENANEVTNRRRSRSFDIAVTGHLIHSPSAPVLMVTSDSPKTVRNRGVTLAAPKSPAMVRSQTETALNINNQTAFRRSVKNLVAIDQSNKEQDATDSYEEDFENLTAEELAMLNEDKSKTKDEEGEEKVKHLAEFWVMLDLYLKDFDCSYTELVTGLLLMAKYHNSRAPRSRIMITDRGIWEEGYRYMKFAAAAYGIMLAALKMKKRMLEFFSGKADDQLSKIQPLQADKNIVFEHLGLPPQDFITGCWDISKLEFIPGYFIALDRTSNSVVLALRGSTNHHDWMTDLCGAAEPFLGGTVHRGMLHSAKMLYDKVGHILLEQIKKTGFKLVVCGHSLGAGVTSLFTIFWHDKHKDIPVQGYCYACPSTVNTYLSTQCRDYVTTFCLGDDCVPRISLGSLEYLRSILEIFVKEGGGNNMSRLLGAMGVMNKKKLKESAARIERENAMKDKKDQLVPPGTIYHFIKQGKNFEMEQTTFQPFMEIIMSTSMFMDHMPHIYEKAFKHLLQHKQVFLEKGLTHEDRKSRRLGTQGSQTELIAEPPKETFRRSMRRLGDSSSDITAPQQLSQSQQLTVQEANGPTRRRSKSLASLFSSDSK